jgi:hypothetical protein
VQVRRTDTGLKLRGPPSARSRGIAPDRGNPIYAASGANPGLVLAPDHRQLLPHINQI